VEARVEDIVGIIEALFPVCIAEDWDNVGLQIGSYKSLTRKVLVALDIDEEIVQYALDEGVDLVITHHPLFFKGIKRINYDDAQGSLIRTLIKQNINVYSAHTNLDAGERGLNQILAERIGLQEIKLLEQGKAFSLGRTGTLAAQMSLEDFCVKIKQSLRLESLRVVGDIEKRVQKIAVVSGAGTAFMSEASRQACDVMLTGDLKYHEARNALDLGLAIIDAGHQETEQIMSNYLRELLIEESKKKGFEVDFISIIGRECIVTI
jgi:dinuclear metal center YbgI/SA1388 family protein